MVYNKNESLFIQVANKILTDILSGNYSVNQQLPTVREMSLVLNINPNTVQKAYNYLETKNLVVSKSTSGRFVTDDEDIIKQCKNDFANSFIEEFLSKMSLLGYSNRDIIDILQKSKEG